MFRKRKIQNKNGIGNTLKTARQKTGLSLKMIAKHIQIDKKYLEALENDKWQNLPGEIYAKNFIKKYCQFLSQEYKVDIDESKIDFSKISGFKHKNYQKDFHKKTLQKDFLNLPKILKIVLIVLIVLTALIYLIWQINSIIQPPEIILFHPVTDLTLTDNSITISGQTEAEVKLKINGEDIILEPDNTFSLTLNLQEGLNTITIEGKKKYSKTRVIERKIICSIYPEEAH